MSKGEIGGDAYAGILNIGSCGRWYCVLVWGLTLGYCRATEGIAMPKELERSISGGERSEETARRLVGSDLSIEFAMNSTTRNRKFARSN